MTRKPQPVKTRGEVWATMSLVERAIHKAQRQIDSQIKYDDDQKRHGGVLRLIEAQRIMKTVRKLAADHEDMV